MEKKSRPETNNQKTQPYDRSAIEVGRQLLADWEASLPVNYFAVDIALQRTLEFHWGREQYRKHGPHLYRFGGIAATTLDAAARLANQDANLPTLERFNRVGQPIEAVEFHPSHHEAGREIYGSEMLTVYGQPGNNLLSMALFYLSSQNGEAGHNCPIACSAGLIKVLQAVGSDGLRAKYLDRLLDPDYKVNFQGAQYVTEIQGGSDVGANASIARPVDRVAGLWLLNGEKWFCSNVTADLALVTARVPGQGRGTRGLGLFLMPRNLDDGRLNNFTIRRLKDKLGTRSLATGEVEFHDALAYQVGPTETGFKNVMAYVINTSRIYNAVGVCGNARRAYQTAVSYARYRNAFGQQIIHIPIVQDTLANMRADGTALLSGTFYIIKQLDEVELGRQGPYAEGFLRLATNLNKYRSAVVARQVILKAIELLGGNGTIETFSVLPRLLRDNIVFENWEGTHNVLLAQAQRDIRKYGVHRPFMAEIREMFETGGDDELQGQGIAQLERIGKELVEVLAMDELTAAIYFRPLMDRLTDLYYVACMTLEGHWELQEKEDRTKLRLASLLLNRRVAGLEPKDIPYYDNQVSRLCQ